MKPTNTLLKLNASQDMQSIDFITESAPITNSLIKQNIKFAKTVLKRCYVSPNKCAQNLPHYLIIGPQGSGKTCLLEASGLHFFEQERLIVKSPEGVSGITHSNWWVSQDAVFIDVPGYYLESSMSNRFSGSVWKHFIKLLKKNVKLKGILVVIDIPLVIASNDSKSKAIIDQLQIRLQELAKILKYPLSMQLIFTKLDVVEGFTEFFDDLSKEEREHGCGITFSNNNHLNANEQFTLEFDKLLQRLNERVIQRLHQTHSIAKKSLIKNFCLQLSALHNNLKKIVFQHSILKQYFNNICLNGVYFCSSKQSLESVDLLFEHIASHLKLASTSDKTLDIKSQPYFVKSLFTELTKLATNNMPFSKKRNYSLRIILYSGLLCLAGIIGSFVFHSYKQQANLLQSTTKIIDQSNIILAQSPNQAKAEDILNTLDKLHQITLQIEQSRSANIFIIGGYQPNLIKNRINLIYDNLLKTQFSALIKNTIELQLARPFNYPPDQVFNALKAYLMLIDNSHLDIDYLRDWLLACWDKQGLKYQPIYLTAHLKRVFAGTDIADNINTHTIYEARKALNSNPEHVLGYMLINQTNRTLIPFTVLLKDQQVFNKAVNFIPTRFTKPGFQDIYAHKIPELNSLAAENTWILGNALHFSSSSLFMNSIKDLYIKDYLSQWELITNRLTIQTFNSYQQALAIISQLAAANSPLYQYLSVLLIHTEEVLAKGQPQLTQSHPLNGILRNYNKMEDEKNIVRYQFKALGDLLSSIANHKEPDKASFDYAQHKLSHATDNDALTQLSRYAQNIPYPLNKWLNEVTANSWQLIAQQAYQYISLKWQKEVMASYSATIDNRYPLNRKAEDEISAKDFEGFFGQSGLINTFFNTYLKGFIDTRQAQWDTYKIYGLGLPTAQESIIQIERAFLIQKMFFGQTGKAGATFSLELIASSPNVAEVDIAIDNQLWQFQQGYALRHRLQWSTDNSFLAISLKDHNGKIATMRFEGPWSLLHFIDKTNLSQTSDVQHYELEYNLGGHIVKFALTADYILNPFVKGVMESFRLDKTL